MSTFSEYQQKTRRHHNTETSVGSNDKLSRKGNHWLSNLLENDQRAAFENKISESIRELLAQVPQLLHSISLLRLAREINWYGSIILVMYGYVFRLLLRKSTVRTRYEFCDFLVDYGFSNLIVAEVAILIRTYFLMLRFHRVMLQIKVYYNKYKGLKSYKDLFYSMGPTVVYSSNVCDSNLHSEMHRSLLRSEKPKDDSDDEESFDYSDYFDDESEQI